MRHIIRSFITLSILSSALPLWGQEQGDKKKETSSQEQYERLVELQEVPVTARRPLSNVGTTMTTLDTGRQWSTALPTYWLKIRRSLSNHTGEAPWPQLRFEARPLPTPRFFGTA